MANQKLNIDIVAKDKSKQAFNRLQGTLSKVKGSIFNLKNAFIGLGAGIVLKGIVSAGMQIEELGVQLEALFGSAKKGKDALDVVTKFAKTTPFELSNIQQGVTALATVSEKAESLGISFEELLKITGNTAVQLGGDFALASQQIQRSFSAGIGSADLFRDRAVTAMAGFSAGVKTSVDESIKGLARAFGTGGKFGELTNKLAGTLKGTISNLKDAFFTIQTEIASGFFDELKTQLGDLKKFTESNDQAIRRLSREIGENLAVAVLKLSDGIKTLTTNFRDIQSVIGLLSIAFGGLFGKILGAGLIVDDINRRFEKLSGNTKKIKVNLDALYDDMPQALEEIKKEAEEIDTFLRTYENELGIKIPSATEKTIQKFRELNEQQLEKMKVTMESIRITAIEGIHGAVKKISMSLAESVVHGKNLLVSLKALAQQVLVNVLAHLIEQVALMGIQKLFKKEELDDEAKKDNLIRKQNTNLKRQIVLQMMLNAVGGGGGSFLGNIFSTSGGSMKRASGGSVQKGQPYMVGEQGAELFIPNSTGQITQSARGTGNGGATTVNFNINTVDASGFEELLVRSRGTITQLINNAVNERGSKNLI
jgi:hypothetical protein